MLRKNSLNKLLQFGFAGITSCIGVFAIATSTLAQQSNIIPDNTLGTENSRLNRNVDINGINADTIDGGARRDINLFHSFSEFNINNGQAVYFVNPDGVENILTRVTGANQSNIFGTLGVDGAANLFLINPGGIVFGENASLDLQGSFVGTTASGLQFGEQGSFSATNPEIPGSLTVNPSALFFNQVEASGGIINNSQAFAGINPDGNFTTGLRVPNGKSLLLVGGEIELDGGRLRAYEGNIELAAFTGEGAVGLDISGDNFSLNIPEDMERGDISLTNQSAISVGGAGGGNLTFNAGNIEISNSFLFAGIGGNSFNPDAQAGDINLNATGLIELMNGSFIYNDVDSFGNAGDININTDSIVLKNGSQINTQTFGFGNAGNIKINARENILFQGNGLFFNDVNQATIITSSVDSQAIGNAGNIQLTTSTLSVNDGVFIASNSFGFGNAGDIIINASDTASLNNNSNISTSIFVGEGGFGGDIQIKTGTFNLINGSILSTDVSGSGNAGNIFIEARDSVNINSSTFPSGIQSNLLTGGVGKGGEVQITTGSLFMNNSYLSTATDGQGNAGNITINAGNQVTFENLIIFTSTGTQAFGDAGNITVTTGDFNVTNNGIISATTYSDSKAGNITFNANTFAAINGGQVNTTTFNSGNAGNINLNIKDKITLSGIGQRFRSGLFASTSPESTGKGGSINIDPRLVIIENGAGVSVGSEGTGDAGDISLQAGTLQLNNGFITAQTASTQGGDINLQISELLLLRNQSQITTTAGTAQAGGDGGNIDINSKFIVSIPEENSDITANAFAGNGGQVDITSSGIFGIETQQSLTDKSDITASSEEAIAGETNINTDDTSSIQNSFTELPPNIDTDAIIANSCIARGNKRQENSFQITGTGALPSNRPGNVLVSNYTTGEVRNIDSKNRVWKKGDRIVEPQGLYRMKNGELLLSRECN